MGKRFAFILGWFAVLFVFNVVVHHDPAANHLIEWALTGLQYMAAPIELIASLGAVIFIVNRTRKIASSPEPKAQDK